MSPILSKFTLFFCLCLSLLLGLAFFGYFKKSLILVCIFLSFLLFLISILRQILKKQLQIKKIDLIIIVLLLLFSLFLSFFHHDLPRGRDDASYLVAAIKITESHSLAFSDKLTHTFTGFRNLDSDRFTSQFLPGYGTYLAVFYNLGGLTLLFWANSLLIFLSLSFIYFLSKNLGGRKTGIISLLFLGTFYTTFWFPRRLISENLFMMLFWSSIFLFFDGILQKKKESLVLGFIPMTLTLFVRGEAIGFWLIYLVIILVHILCDRKKCKQIAKTSFTSNTLNISNVRIYYDCPEYPEACFGDAGHGNQGGGAATSRKKAAQIPRSLLRWRLYFLLILTIFDLIIFIYYLKIYNGLSYFIFQFYSPFKFFISLFALLFPILLILFIVLVLMFFWQKQVLRKIFQFI
ncbi:MAG: hypothetical protein AB1465_00880, partial [Patescibacteria group bacterium]